ncbi:MAG: tRNA pseudouridine(38-40) synthase TruA [Acidobacteriota bacterium]|nr:tRNA pseudouridine(38-40) synthase TruA [Blastocatellia bacterium]MDW8411509.1 tRNA pseudouridine(38-40) synthase TruA [Acidobacteriota bacterium]
MSTRSTNVRLNWKLTIEYDGTRYSGWQVQKNAKSIQGTLIKAAENILQCEVEICGAGRTDAGVHAIGQVAHMRYQGKLTSADFLLKAINASLPKDINLLKVERADLNFHARHDAVSRYYLYQLSRRRTALAKNFVWWIKDELDVEAMSAAATAIAGMHDFRAFTEQNTQTESTLVKVEEAKISTWGDLILFRIGASHFLWKMVRRLVGALVAVGRKTLSIAEFSQLLQGYTDPRIAEWTAPPSGLFLTQVLYKGDSRQNGIKPVLWF